MHFLTTIKYVNIARQIIDKMRQLQHHTTGTFKKIDNTKLGTIFKLQKLKIILLNGSLKSLKKIGQ